nr:MAG TPA: hypothetical protein [Caudoviricetes sp.]
MYNLFIYSTIYSGVLDGCTLLVKSLVIIA